MGKNGITANTLILVVTAYLVISGNFAFISGALRAYPPDAGNSGHLLSLIVVLGGAMVLLLSMLCVWRATKPVLITVLLLSAAVAHFMDSYGVVINDDMLRNVVLTQTAEVLELLNARLLFNFVLLGALPAWAIYRVPLQSRGWRIESIARFKLVSTILTLMIGTVWAFGGFYASFFREHRELRQYVNPLYFLYSTVKYASSEIGTASKAPMLRVGTDAAIPVTDVSRELVVMVVGETARADRFSVNGYVRETNPRLQESGAISFTNFRACGTSTAVSVPCMFLRDGESRGALAIKTEENLLDVLIRSGVNVLWLDNNSDSKGVAARAPYIDYRSPKTNPACDTECRDEGMLAGLQRYIDAHPKGDIFIVLHQMGNHGPAYFNRYPPQFERFTPVCKSTDLSKCSLQEIGNAYDNAILYTDYFLAKTIDLLRRNDDRFETAMFYVGDHGESLGENGIYLHGMPKALAPEAQLHVPAIMWFGKNFRNVTPGALRKKSGIRYTHENVFHTILGFFEIKTTAYRPEGDILTGAKPAQKSIIADRQSGDGSVVR